jgi:uncharacterized protein YuzE
MKIKCFQDTDTLYIELCPGEANATKDLDKNILLDLDGDGQLCTITIGHTSQPTAAPPSSCEQFSV